MGELIRLNLGSGDVPLDGYVNIDRKNGQEAYPLACEDDSVDEIRASHLLEHFPKHQTEEVMAHWVKKLKPGGVLKIAVPDLAALVALYQSSLTDSERSAEKKGWVAAALLGGQTDENDYHKMVFDAQTLEYLLRVSGLIRIEPWNDSVKDCSSLPVSLNLQGTKPTEEQKKPRRIQGIMSTGRLMFSQNASCAAKAFGDIGIPFQIGTGVYWEQILTTLIESALSNGAEYIVTTDYDTWYTTAHLKKLLSLMAEYPEADAIVSLQAKREEDRLLIGKEPKSGETCVQIPATELQRDIYPIDTGHFGLTVFRAAAFERLPKPWFLGIPGPDNRWADNRRDPDIYFWQKWRQTGNTAFLATRVSVGHLQLMCTFPDIAEHNWKPIHFYINDVNAGKIPGHCKL